MSTGRLTAHVTGMLVDRPRTPCGGGRGEVKVVSVGLTVSGLHVGRLLQYDNYAGSIGEKYPLPDIAAGINNKNQVKEIPAMTRFLYMAFRKNLHSI